MSTKFRRALIVTFVLLLAAAFAPAAHADQTSKAQPFIVGGHDVSIGDHPYVVYLVDGRDHQFCGGTLVEHDTVLTAAHCAAAVRPYELGVVAGRQDTRMADGIEAGVRSVWLAPGYQDPTAGNDIAVLKLDRPVPYRPARLPSGGDSDLYRPGTEAMVLGWGRLWEGGDKATELQGATVPVMSDSQCIQAYGSYEPDTMMCAGYPEGGVDACHGDSGGPLVVGDILVGIVSWGDGCAKPGKPGVYTRVATYSDHVESLLVRLRG